jgi:hypothetical protein
MGRSGRWTIAAAAAVWFCAVGTASAQVCSGDCNGDGQLGLAELIAGVAIALGDSAVSGCRAVDANGDGTVRIDEVTRATVAQETHCAAPVAAAPRGGGVVTVAIGSANGNPGQLVSFPVTLDTGGLLVAGVQVDIGFTPTAPVARRSNGRPDCTVNAAIDKGGTSYAFQPSGCSGPDCTGMRALVRRSTTSTPSPTARCSSATPRSPRAPAARLSPARHQCRVPGSHRLPAGGRQRRCHHRRRGVADGSRPHLWPHPAGLVHRPPCSPALDTNERPT